MIHLPLLVVYSLAQGLAASALLKQFRLQRSAAGVSYQTLLALVIGHVGSFMFALVLPLSLSTLIYALASAFSAVCLGVVLRVGFVTFAGTYQAQLDVFGRVLHAPRSGAAPATPSTGDSPEPAAAAGYSSLVRPHWAALYALAAVLAAAIEAGRRHKQLGVPLSFLGSFSDALLALALLPQLLLMFRSDKAHVARAIGTAVLFWSAARAASLAFWALEASIPGRGVKLLTEPLNLAALALITYHARARPLDLPLGKSSSC